tara:strand:+ start:119 stop:499 length:381 start_codon:yes stop_codon:yes gene_type:complete
MAVYENIKVISLELNAATVTQYAFVKISGADGQVITGAGDTDIICGVAQETQAVVGATVPTAIAGISKIWVDSAAGVGFGNQLTCSANGGAVAAVAGDMVHGIAVEAGADDDIIGMILYPSSQLLA